MTRMVWGSPPRREDCSDGGTIDVIRRVIDPDGVGALDGMSYPVEALLREARYKVRNKAKPLRVIVRGAGELLIGDDGWEYNSTTGKSTT